MTMDDEGGGEWGVVANVSVHIFHFSFKHIDWKLEARASLNAWSEAL